MKTLRALAALAAATLLPLTAGGPTMAAAQASPPPEPQLLAAVDASYGAAASFRGRLWFSGATDATGVELWVTDGTPAGTRLAVDLVPGAVGSGVENLVVLGDRLLFTAETPATGIEWFSTDGTAAGTTIVQDLRPGDFSSAPMDPVVLGGRVYFSAFENTHGRELWSTDGTAAGTKLAADVWPGAGSSNPLWLTVLGNRVVFRASDRGTISRPWVTVDGTFGATRLDVESDQVDLDPRELVRLGSQIVFVAGNAASGSEIWVTGGVPGDAHGIRDVYPGPTSSVPAELTVVGNRVMFRARTPVVGRELWATDGTAAGTILVRDIDPRPDVSSSPRHLRALGDQLLFTADDGVHGGELWTSRGTAASTQMVLDGYAGPAAGDTDTDGLRTASVAGRELYAGTDASGQEPWVTDGTAAGTRRIGDLSPGAAGSSPFAIGSVGNTIVLGAGFDTEARLYAWTAVASSTGITTRKHYSPKQARKRKIVLPVTVTDELGGAPSGGTVTLTRRGKVVGTGVPTNGRVGVRIIVRLRPGRTHRVTATWSGSLLAAGSTSTAVKVRIKGKRR